MELGFPLSLMLHESCSVRPRPECELEETLHLNIVAV